MREVRVAAWDPALYVVPKGLGFFAAHVPISAGARIIIQLPVTPIGFTW